CHRGGAGSAVRARRLEVRGHVMRARLLAMLLALAGCTQTGDTDRGHQAPALARPAPPARPSPDAGAAMTNTRDKLPSPFDVRVQRALAAPLADDVAIAFDHITMAKSPKTNYRFTVTTDGSVFYVQRSSKAGDWQVPFDQPLPGKPA